MLNPPNCQDLSDPETGSSASTEVAGGEEISTLNISDPDVDTEDALEWDVLQDVIHRSKAVTGKDFEDDFCFIFFSQMGLDLKMLGIYIPNEIAIFKNGIMISKTIGFRGTNLFSDKPKWLLKDLRGATSQ